MIDPAILDAMVASGCTAEQIASAVKAACAAAEKAKDDRRAKDRARKAKSRTVHAIPQESTEVHNVTRTDVESTDKGDLVPLSPVPLLPPHTPLITPLPPNPSQKQNSRGTRLPDDWQLSGPDLAYALSKGLTEREAGELGERMKSWALSASGSNAVKRNWHQAYQGWVQREGPVIIRNRGGPSAKPLTAFQQRRNETQEILNGLDNFARGSGISGQNHTRLLGHNPGERPAAIRDGPREDADDFSHAGYRSGN